MNQPYDKCPLCGYYAFNGEECFDCGYRPHGRWKRAIGTALIVIAGSMPVAAALFDWAPPEKFKSHGAISIKTTEGNTMTSHSYGGVTKSFEPGSVQYWLSIDLANKDYAVNPPDVTITSAHEPVVAKTNGAWIITFR